MVTTAYIFFHVPRQGVDPALYAGRLIHFHERLHSAMTGQLWYRGSVAFRHLAVPDVPLPEPTYSDWYVISDISALGQLNEAAAAGDLAMVHGNVAAFSQAGAGAVYSFIAGEDAVPHGAKFAYWLRKPSDLSRDSLRARLARLILDVPYATAWQRQMALGPSPEIVITSPTPMDLPPIWSPYYTQLDEI
jgi:hypothetical protein